MRRITRWTDWCRLWSEEGARHQSLAQEAAAKGLGSRRQLEMPRYGGHSRASLISPLGSGCGASACCTLILRPTRRHWLTSRLSAKDLELEVEIRKDCEEAPGREQFVAQIA